MENYIRSSLVITIGLLLVGSPFAYHRYQKKHYRNIRVVTTGKLYRSGQLSPDALRDFIHQHNIGTVITLRSNDGSKEDPSQWEAEMLDGRPVKHVRIPAGLWRDEDDKLTLDQAAAKFLEVIRDEKKYARPVLIHCYAGVHRTGTMCALYRMEVDGWPNEKAIHEMVQCGYTTLDRDEDLKEYLENYYPGQALSQNSR